MMDSTLAAATTGAALAASAGVNRWLAKVALRLGWCDSPPAVSRDCHRFPSPSSENGGCTLPSPSHSSHPSHSAPLKIHTKPIPLVGGIGIILALAAAVALSAAGTRPHWGIILTGLPALLLGAWDDLRWKNATVPIPKFAAQTAVALSSAAVLWLTGVKVIPDMPAASLALAAAYVLAAVNAVNLEDGLDGLAGGEAAISALGFALILSARGQTSAALVAFALTGALAGFLTLNWHPARIFLGDGGSHLTGALLAALALTTLNPTLLPALPATALIIGLPVADTLWVIAARLASGRSLMTGDRTHLYDILRRRGLSIRQTVGICWTAQAALVAIGIIWASRLR
jgi:UDP-GlcNAc:undecaprenyl-phosphate GlcNAc-1-phosphate transferase